MKSDSADYLDGPPPAYYDDLSPEEKALYDAKGSAPGLTASSAAPVASEGSAEASDAGNESGPGADKPNG